MAQTGLGQAGLQHHTAASWMTYTLCVVAAMLVGSSVDGFARKDDRPVRILSSVFVIAGMALGGVAHQVPEPASGGLLACGAMAGISLLGELGYRASAKRRTSDSMSQPGYEQSGRHQFPFEAGGAGGAR